MATASDHVTASDRTPDVPHLALIALGAAVLAHVIRVLFPIMFEIGEDWDSIAAGLVALGVSAAPVLARPLLRSQAAGSPIGGAVAMAASLIVLRLAEPIPAWLASSPSPWP